MFLAFRSAVEEALEGALSALELPTGDLGLEDPPPNVDAVLASSVAFRLANEAGRPPPVIAAEIADAIDADEHNYIGSVTHEGPYVNFTPDEDYFTETVEAATDEAFGRLPAQDVSVIVEHTSANPTGPIHVGRARNPILGDAIARVLDFAGYDVETHYYVNDAGRQIAVFTWAYETFDEADLPEPDRDRIEYELVRYYRKGNAYLEEAEPEAVEAAEAEIQSIMQGLESGDKEAYERVTAVVDQVLSGMRECLGRLPASFDEFVKETRFLRDGSTAAIIDRLKDLPQAELDEDAWQLDLSADGIDKPMVFVRSDGTSLYPTRDLAHHEWKLDRADRAVTVLGEDHKLQAAQLSAALEHLGTDSDRIDQVFYSWVNLPEGGMSTREGTGVNLDDLLDEAIARARQEVEERLDTRIRDDELEAADIDRIARQVGIGAVRYDIVSKQPTKGITFRWEEALDFEAQSAPYVQYVHARCCGILDGVRVPDDYDPSVLRASEERDLIREIARFPAVVEEAAAERHPHLVATYTRDIAETYNTFYRECPVLGADDPERRSARLALVEATKHTVSNALDLLGIEAPDSM